MQCYWSLQCEYKLLPVLNFCGQEQCISPSDFMQGPSEASPTPLLFGAFYCLVNPNRISINLESGQCCCCGLYSWQCVPHSTNLWTHFMLNATTIIALRRWGWGGGFHQVGMSPDGNQTLVDECIVLSTHALCSFLLTVCLPLVINIVDPCKLGSELIVGESYVIIKHSPNSVKTCLWQQGL